MQPQQPIPSDIKTLHDYLYRQFSATEPIEVQNILDKPYFFKYCVSEDIETPDPISRRVVRRDYEEHTLQPGETKIFLGGAAYIFVAGVAQQYVFETKGADATADLSSLIEAADKVIIGKVGYAPTPTSPSVTPQAAHNPNVVKDDDGVLPEQSSKDSDAFDSVNADERFVIVPATDSDDGKAHFFVDGKEVSNTKYNKASNAASATNS